MQEVQKKEGVKELWGRELSPEVQLAFAKMQEVLEEEVKKTSHLDLHIAMKG